MIFYNDLKLTFFANVFFLVEHLPLVLSQALKIVFKI